MTIHRPQTATRNPLLPPYYLWALHKLRHSHPNAHRPPTQPPMGPPRTPSNYSCTLPTKAKPPTDLTPTAHGPSMVPTQLPEGPPWTSHNCPWAPHGPHPTTCRPSTDLTHHPLASHIPHLTACGISTVLPITPICLCPFRSLLPQLIFYSLCLVILPYMYLLFNEIKMSLRTLLLQKKKKNQ